MARLSQDFTYWCKETFPWVEKNVEGRLTTILRHRMDIDWSGGALILIREFYASHSYNSSQWITGCSVSRRYRGLSASA